MTTQQEAREAFDAHFAAGGYRYGAEEREDACRWFCAGFAAQHPPSTPGPAERDRALCNAILAHQQSSLTHNGGRMWIDVETMLHHYNTHKDRRDSGQPVATPSSEASGKGEDAPLREGLWMPPSGMAPVAHAERTQAEHAYIMTTFDYCRDPVGSDAWCDYWRGWCHRSLYAAATPDKGTVPDAGEAAAVQGATAVCTRLRPGESCEVPQSCADNGCNAVEREIWKAAESTAPAVTPEWCEKMAKAEIASDCDITAGTAPAVTEDAPIDTLGRSLFDRYSIHSNAQRWDDLDDATRLHWYMEAKVHLSLLGYPALTRQVEALQREVERLRDVQTAGQAAADRAEQAEAALREAREDAAYLRWRLDEILPLFEEARDALPAITISARYLRGISLTLADRMDAAGTRTRDQFDAARAATKDQGAG